MDSDNYSIDDDLRALRHVKLEYGYTLKVWDTFRTDGMGKSILGYRLRDPQGEDIFWGTDFGCSPLYSIDSDETLRAILGFLTLKPGDTDAEYFANYTEKQMEFARSSECEYLAMYSLDDLEEGPMEFEEIEEL